MSNRFRGFVSRPTLTDDRSQNNTPSRRRVSARFASVDEISGMASANAVGSKIAAALMAVIQEPNNFDLLKKYAEFLLSQGSIKDAIKVYTYCVVADDDEESKIIINKLRDIQESVEIDSRGGSLPFIFDPGRGIKESILRALKG